jgi:hypothetical protein
LCFHRYVAGWLGRFGFFRGGGPGRGGCFGCPLLRGGPPRHVEACALLGNLALALGRRAMT